MSDVTAPMGGKIIDVKVSVGDAVNENDEVVNDVGRQITKKKLRY